MMRLILISLSIFTTLAVQGSPLAQGTADKPDAPRQERRMVVVVSTKNPVTSLTSAELARVYLRKKTQWSNGESITVYERPVKTELRQAFSKTVLGKTPEAMREYWMNLTLTRGLKPPKVLRSAKLVRRYLTRVKGGIGYLYEDEIDETVKVVQIVWKKNS